MSDRAFLSICRTALLAAAMLMSPFLPAAPSIAGDNDTSAPAASKCDGHGMVMGVGLVVGLPGTGDSSVDQGFVEQSIVGVLKRAGLDLWRDQIEPGRVAKVLITAELPANAGDGARIAVHITAIGDAASLAGGTLLATPLRDENGKVYGVGQGTVEVARRGALAAGQPQQDGAGARDAVLALGAVIDARRPGQVASD
jgi:flagellar P-ring protein precursor FlgI